MTNISAADTGFVFICACLVLLMTPGLALFYGGMVRSKNVLSTTMHSYASMFIVSIQWVLIGYSIAFAPGNPFSGGFGFAFLNGVGGAANPAYAATIPQTAFIAKEIVKIAEQISLGCKNIYVSSTSVKNEALMMAMTLAMVCNWLQISAFLQLKN